MTDNGTIETLAALIRGANLSEDQRKLLGAMTKPKHVRARGNKRHKKTGPYAHCKPGDPVTVAFPDGTMLKMNVYKVGPNAMRLSDLPYESLVKRSQGMQARVARYGRAISALEYVANKFKKDGTPLPVEGS